MPCTNKPPCGSGYIKYRLASGKMCCRKSKGSSMKKPSSTKSSYLKKTKKETLSASDLKNMKNKLKASFSMVVDGKSKSPPFIGTLKDVTGHGAIEKIANLRRVLSTCRKMGVPLMRSDGKKFKTYKTKTRMTLSLFLVLFF